MTRPGRILAREEWDEIVRILRNLKRKRSYAIESGRWDMRTIPALAMSADELLARLDVEPGGDWGKIAPNYPGSPPSTLGGWTPADFQAAVEILIELADDVGEKTPKDVLEERADQLLRRAGVWEPKTPPRVQEKQGVNSETEPEEPEQDPEQDPVDRAFEEAKELFSDIGEAGLKLINLFRR
jgi:hypothetical protein